MEETLNDIISRAELELFATFSQELTTKFKDFSKLLDIKICPDTVILKKANNRIRIHEVSFTFHYTLIKIDELIMKISDILYITDIGIFCPYSHIRGIPKSYLGLV